MYPLIEEVWNQRSARSEWSTSGIYGLFDDLTGFIRYVGSSKRIQERVYAHRKTLNSKKSHNLQVVQWAREMKARGVLIQACVLEEIYFGTDSSAIRHQAEARWIAHFKAMGEADLNTVLLPETMYRTSMTFPQKIHRMQARVEHLEMLLRKHGIQFPEAD